jgi:hypothetical protein
MFFLGNQFKLTEMGTGSGQTGKKRGNYKNKGKQKLLFSNVGYNDLYP